MATDENLESQPMLSRLAVLLGLMAFASWAIYSLSQIFEIDMYWQIIAIVIVAGFVLNYNVFVTQVPELTTVLVVDELFGNKRPPYQGPGIIFTFPWEEVKNDNVFTNETFSKNDLEESVPGKDNFRGVIRGYITVEITPSGAKTFNARGSEAKAQALNYLDGIFRQFASSMVKSSDGQGRISIDELVDRKKEIIEAFMPYLEEKHVEELFRLYGLEFRDCQIKDVDYDDASRQILSQRAARTQQISGDNELMEEVFKIVAEKYGDRLSADEKRDAADSIMAGMSATGENVTNRITSIAGVNTSELVKGVLEFLKSREAQ